jgi:hypothetical protein
MSQDILRDSWVYQEIGQSFLLEGIEKELQRNRQTVISCVEMKFPEQVSFAQQQVEQMTDIEVFQQVLIKLFAAQTVQEVQGALLSAPKNTRLYD